jgi:acetolactate synthase-1/2/3 large subunit
VTRLTEAAGTRTVAAAVADALRLAGIRRVFGVPGGSAGAEIIEATSRAGLSFTLAHTEEAGAFMACAQAELSGVPGVCIATLGPGVASVANGVAHASLDRVPLLILTDRHPADLGDVGLHQTFDHSALLGPITKATEDLTNDEEQVARALRLAADLPGGPVHLDCAVDILVSPSAGARPPARPSAAPVKPSREKLDAATDRLLRRARRPLVIAGLGARRPEDARAIRQLAASRGLPVLVTYKAKGVIPDVDPLFGGVFTDGALEASIVDRSDLILAIGLDPVELLPKKWRHRQPVVYIGAWPLQQKQIPLAASLVGDISSLIAEVETLVDGALWDPAEISSASAASRDGLRVASLDGLAPSVVVDTAASVFRGARVTVDAGAHMFPAMGLWPAANPNDMLISNGLATMGFSLPSAIGAALAEPSRTVVAFTGDGGLLMCAAELRTAAREALPVKTIVFDDASLSLIRIKQEQRSYAPIGVDLQGVDWSRLGQAFGVASFRATNESELRRCFAEANDVPGPALISARVDPAVYSETIRRLRG